MIGAFLAVGAIVASGFVLGCALMARSQTPAHERAPRWRWRTPGVSEPLPPATWRTPVALALACAILAIALAIG